MQTSLVGDLILGLRESATDPPLYLPPPSNVAAAVSGGTATTNFYFVVTQLTPWGESGPCAEVSVLLGLLTGTITITGNCSYSAIALKVYVSIIAPGAEDRYFYYTSPGVGAFSITFTLSSPLINGYPTQRSSAALPDTDGTALSASSIYRWINEGLDAATAICEGIRDITGIPTTGGQAQYQVLGNWRKMSDGFYDGYPFAFGGKQDVFRHSNVTGITASMVMNQDAQVQQVEIWPQASRTAGTGTLASGIGATDTILTYTPGATGLVLGFGLALLGPYPSDLGQCEIIYYSGSGSGSQLTQLTRGMGGTHSNAWPSGTQVTELNIYLSGTRLPQHYVVGQSANILSLPPAWIDAMRVYLEYRFKKAEQDVDNAQKLYNEFKDKCKGISGLRQPMGPRQIQVGSGSGIQTVPGAGGYFGGIVLP
jgi:hypothetical protein